MEQKFSVGRLAVWVVAVELVGIVGGLVTVEAIPNWYAGLEKPWFNPPNWLFGPVWTLLYAMVGYVGYRLWQRPGTGRLRRLFLIQLALNGVWTPVFFGLRAPEVALAIIAALLVVLARLLILVWREQRGVFWWLLPYFGWVLFASGLNWAIAYLN